MPLRRAWVHGLSGASGRAGSWWHPRCAAAPRARRLVRANRRSGTGIQRPCRPWLPAGRERACKPSSSPFGAAARRDRARRHRRGCSGLDCPGCAGHRRREPERGRPCVRLAEQAGDSRAAPGIPTPNAPGGPRGCSSCAQPTVHQMLIDRVVSLGTSATSKLPGAVGQLTTQLLTQVGATVDRVLPTDRRAKGVQQLGSNPAHLKLP